jgi:hypothetical protein
MKQTCLAVIIHMYIKYNSMLPIIMCKYIYRVESEPVSHALVDTQGANKLSAKVKKKRQL